MKPKTALDELKRKLKKTDNDENVIRNFNRHPKRTEDSLVALLFENTFSQIPSVNFATNSIGTDGMGSTEDLSTIATKIKSRDGPIKNLVVTQWKKLFPNEVIANDVETLVTYLIWICVIAIPIDEISNNVADGDGDFILSGSAVFSLVAVEIAIIVVYIKPELIKIRQQWLKLQNEIVDDPMYAKHSEKIKELFVNVKTRLLDAFSIIFDSRTTAVTETADVGVTLTVGDGATEGSGNHDPSQLKAKETLKTYLTLLDKELMENKDTIALYLFQNSTKDISHLLEQIFSHYIYKNTINAKTKKHLKILSEILRFGYF